MALIEVSGLVKAYGTPAGPLTILNDLAFTVEAGEMVAIVGASGVGKSTLLHVLGGLDVFDAGTVRIGDADIGRMDDEARVRFRNRRVGFVFQFHHLLPEFTAIENVEMPLRLAEREAAGREAEAAALLARVGLAHRATHRPGALSGGEQQRVAVARALVCRPALLLADEPTGNLDEHTAAELHALLREMHREHGLTSIIATHNTALAASCDRTLRLEAGKLVGAQA
ncbi:MAG TPA: ABC transporter ATP-binding protein [Vicinamibacterales bacterium]|nr:ABC transporter ATP-binding protein [Vicinamibacterales bacterium]